MPTKEKLKARQATLKARRHELDLEIADLQTQIDSPPPVAKKRPKPKAPSKKPTARRAVTPKPKKP